VEVRGLCGPGAGEQLNRAAVITEKQ